MPRFIWWGLQIGHVQEMHRDGSLTAWFPPRVGHAPGYHIRLWPGEWTPA
jgi:hypothetical protein